MDTIGDTGDLLYDASRDGSFPGHRGRRQRRQLLRSGGHSALR